MADPSTILLRQATLLMQEANDALDATAATQALRWGRLRRVVEDAGDQYWDMRIGAIEESLRDKGGPMWLSVAISVALSFVPITYLTTKFLGSLTTATQKLLTRANRTQLGKMDVQLYRELDVDRWMALSDKTDELVKSIAKTEQTVVRFYQKQLDPEVSNMLQNYADKLGQAAANWPFSKSGVSTTMTKGPKGNAPVVVVKDQFHDWIDLHMNAEAIARRAQKERVKNLFAIATATEPKKESEQRFKAAKDAEAARQPEVPRRQVIDPLPQGSKEALAELERIRDDSAPSADELFTASEKDELMDLQLMIEGAIWASAYDFTPVIKKSASKIGPPEVQHVALSDALWQRLIERYIDPDEGKSYKDVGPLYRMGTKSKPGINEKASREILQFDAYSKGWSPQTRLSWFFGQLLYPELLLENSRIVKTIKAR